MQLKAQQAFLQFSGTANFYYATNCDFGLHAIIKGKHYLFTSFMDYELAKERFHGKVIPVKRKKDTFEWLKKRGVREILLPVETSYARVKDIEKAGFSVKVTENPFTKKREIKSANEIKLIRECCNAAVKAFEYALKLVKKIRSCEELKKRTQQYLYSKGFVCNELIVSSGKYSAVPHATGVGRIGKHAIIDIFPRSLKTKYHADFTRTVLLEEKKEIEEMLIACIEAKNLAIKSIKDGAIAREIYNLICDVLEEHGFSTLRKNSSQGFIHAAGHGVGLEIHEAPSLSEDSEEVLRKGMVLTVEPGLYYKKYGGVRVEDTVLVGKARSQVLTKYRDFVRINRRNKNR